MRRKTLAATTLAGLSALLMSASAAVASSSYETRDGAVNNGDGTYTIDTRPTAVPPYGAVVRPGDQRTVAEYENNLSVSWERTATCGGGSPRFNLVFADGDYLTTDGKGSPGFDGCALEGSFDPFAADPATTSVWRCHSNGGSTCQSSAFLDWSQVLALYGDEEVTESALVDDSYWRAASQSLSVYTPVLGPAMRTKDDCKKGGWEALGYRNQGQCVSRYAHS